MAGSMESIGHVDGSPRPIRVVTGLLVVQLSQSVGASSVILTSFPQSAPLWQQDDCPHGVHRPSPTVGVLRYLVEGTLQMELSLWRLIQGG